MKRYLKNFKFSPSFITFCIYECLRKKWKRTDTSYFFAEYILKFKLCEEDLHTIAKKCKAIACDKESRNKFDGLIQRISLDMYNDITNRNIALTPIKYEKRIDKSNHKEREIGISSIKQQVFDYIAVNACKEMFLAKIGFYQCASLKGKGQLFGKRAIESWLRKDKSGTKYAYKCDIKKFYPSINHDNIKRLLSRDIKNKDVLYLLFTLIDSYNKGLCIGSYLSQYLANYYLSYAYHYISENSYTIRNHKDGTHSRENHITHILFYMDDVVMFSSNKKYLKRAVDDLKKYLKEFLLLEIKSDDRLFKVDGDRIDMMGFVITRTHTIIRKRIFRRICKIIRKVRKYKGFMTFRQAKSLISYNGWIKYTNSYNFKQKYNINKLMYNAKKVVSNYEKSNIYRKTA